MRDGPVSRTLTFESFRCRYFALVCVAVMLLLCLEAGGCARLRMVEKETYDQKSDTYTTKYKNLPAWSEYALGTLAGAIWGLATLSWLIPTKAKPEPRKTADSEEREKAEAKADYMLRTGRENVTREPGNYTDRH